MTLLKNFFSSEASWTFASTFHRMSLSLFVNFCQKRAAHGEKVRKHAMAGMRQYHVTRGKYMVADSLIKGAEKWTETDLDGSVKEPSAKSIKYGKY